MGNEQYKGKFFDTFGIIYDKRQQGKVRHKLIDILFIIVSALFAKIDEVEEIYMWATAEQNKKWLKKYIALENGIPSISTIRRVLNTVNPKQFEKCFISWTRELTIFSENGGDIVAIDGKTMRGSKNGDKITHIVNAWCSANNLVLGQVKTDEKSNEITAILELLDLLYLEGCIVTIDAMGCQTKIVKKIKKKKADYVISLKGNQGTLHNEVKEYYEDLKEEMDKIEKGNHESVKMVRTLDKGHGRIEERKYFYSTDIDWMIDARKDWTGLSGIGMVYRKVTEKDKVREEVQYYIGSIKDVSQFAKAVRGHWGVESMHWSLDVTFKMMLIKQEKIWPLII
ncbi:ISAs1 family transposase [Acetivibrio clariflavus]|uniref:Transposase n=1 Tax=Acetivibrio clariflavus (strain DSM 19732 / NBRC 101661 / EBR45) TaxID=720554 RepID=G8M038_ACECE|nr:ISAs1 family transposase [Acetivibrio clariflavus]AEV70145.1 transposase [Acetivibrio clariflavus DSM 19732]